MDAPKRTDTMPQALTRYLGSLLVVFAIPTQLLAASSATTTSLAVLPGGPISEGTIVTFVATVKNGAPVNHGSVYFCKPQISACLLGEGLYGTAELTSNGTARLRTRLNVGNNDVLAVFLATKQNLGSASPATGVTVAPRVIYPSMTSLTALGAPGNYTLTGTVSSFGKEQMSGTISLLNATENNSDIGSAVLSNPVIGLSNTVPYNVGHLPSAVATGDFNGDGIPDLVVANENNNNVSVLLGNGDGTFQQQTTWATDQVPESIVVGDFNGDDIPDMAVADTNGNCVSILIGNGDGSFQNEITYPVGHGPVSIATGDFNNDGVADLVVADYTAPDVSVMLGNGDGTFQAASPFPAGSGPRSVVVGDFNSDGFMDLAVANVDEATVSIFLGNGDGTFQPQSTLVTEGGPYSLATADLNNDGILDLVVANRNSNTVSIFLGNGNGTFQNQVNLPTGLAPDAVVVGDFNGDGIPDLAVCNQFDGTISILLGEGNAVFSPQQTYATGFNAYSLVAGDFNGDGLTDLANTDIAELNVRLGQQVASFSTSGISNLSAQTNWVFASYPGDDIRIPSQSSTVPLTGTADTATVTLFSAPNPATVGTVVTFSASVVGVSGVAPTGQVIFRDGTTVLGTSAIAAGTATMTIGDLAVGTHSITATYVGDSNYAASTSMPLVQTISKMKATISLTSSVNPAVYGNMISITATVTKGATGTVVFMDGDNNIGSSVVSGDGSAAISTTGLAAGLHTIIAIYSGDQNFQ